MKKSDSILTVITTIVAIILFNWLDSSIAALYWTAMVASFGFMIVHGKETPEGALPFVVCFGIAALWAGSAIYFFIWRLPPIAGGAIVQFVEASG